MAHIALRVPTIYPDGHTMVGGHCYIVFDLVPLTLADLIGEKVRAELRKARAGGPVSTTLPQLLDVPEVGYGPLDEQIAVAMLQRRVVEGAITVLIDGVPLRDLSTIIAPSRRLGIAFMIPTPNPTSIEEVLR